MEMTSAAVQLPKPVEQLQRRAPPGSALHINGYGVALGVVAIKKSSPAC
jgi:hypothetical protein